MEIQIKNRKRNRNRNSTTDTYCGTTEDTFTDENNADHTCEYDDCLGTYKYYFMFSETFTKKNLTI